MENMTEEKTKAYELRDLTADDMFPMFQIISKIGIREFKSCFESESVKKLAAEMATGEASGDELKATVGVTVAFDLASVILSNLPNCRDDIYLLPQCVLNPISPVVATNEKYYRKAGQP